ncbi:MAG: tyrosine-type recombinase/integrase [Telluria sp.]|nr:tyrosine-type recombinase/integrase [Telluria sp.]
MRFTWNGERRCETLRLPQSQKGIAAAASLRAQVASLAKIGVLDDSKYIELFPNSSYISASAVPTFGEYAQLWLDSREIVEGTRKNYKGTLNIYWMPVFALTPVDQIQSTDVRRAAAAIEWTSSGVKRNALIKLGTVLKAAMHDGLIKRNPLDSIERPRQVRKQVDPFTVDEAEQIIGHLYANDHWPTRIYAAYFEFAFYTGMRPAEIMALRLDEVDTKGRQTHVCRVVADRAIHERTKTKRSRHVLLNERALHALTEAGKLAAEKTKGQSQFKGSPYVFPPARGSEFIQESSVTDKHFKQALRDLGIRNRPQYNCRHTYATMCLMAGMNPAFIAGQLGHSVQMLLSTYARWINSTSDWDELAKLQIGTKLVQQQDQPGWNPCRIRL